MKMNELCRKTGLTRKAVEYYQNKGLVSPEISENGYREFSDEEAEILRQVALLRQLELSVEEIQEVLNSSHREETLIKIKELRKIQLGDDGEQLEILGDLISGGEEAAWRRLEILNRKTAIKKKIILAFPGFEGRMISFQFGRYLNEPIQTAEQEEAYGVVMNFLDSVRMPEISREIPAEVKEGMDFWTEERMEQVHEEKEKSYEDVAGFLEKNRDMLKEYRAFKESEAYRNSYYGKMEEALRTFIDTSGYVEIFIPALRRLSPSYDAYYRKALKANEEFMKLWPEKEG